MCSLVVSSVVLRFFVLCGRYTAGHVISELIVGFFWCCLIGCRVGVGRVQGVFLVCLVNVDRVLTPVDSALIASSPFFFFFFFFFL